MKDEISLRTDRCTLVLLGQHFINTTCHSNMFRPLKCHLQGVRFIPSSSNFNK
jgi:hypothetical protein